MKRRINFFPALVILVSIGIMVVNSLSYPAKSAYDYGAHYQMARANEALKSYTFKYTGTSDYNPALYYVIIGKLNHGLEVIFGTKIDPTLTGRWLFLLLLAITGFLYCYGLLPRLTESVASINLISLSMFLIPCFYKMQIMARPGHFLFLFTFLLIYFWFRYDFKDELHKSMPRQLIWALLLIGAANVRHLAFPMFVIFLVWGGWLLLYNSFVRKEGIGRVRAVSLILIVVIFAGWFYISRIFREGKMLEVSGSEDTYLKRYSARTRGFDYMKLFGNMEFYKLIKNAPNRLAGFGEVDEFTRNDYERYIMPQMKIRWDRKMMRTLFDMYRYDHVKDSYVLIDQSEENKKKAYGILRFVVNNSFFPRLYGSMWADHWLYVSGPRMKDNEVFWKKATLIAAIPFTLLYFLLPLPYGVRFVRRVFSFKKPDIYDISGILFYAGVLILVLFVYKYPLVGKNSTVKFAYLLGFIWFPLICFADFFKKHENLLKYVLAYTIGLFLLCLPLNII